MRIGSYLETRREPKGVHLSIAKWRVAWKLAADIVKVSPFIVKPFGTTGHWTVATKIRIFDTEASLEEKAHGCDHCPNEACDRNEYLKIASAPVPTVFVNPSSPVWGKGCFRIPPTSVIGRALEAAGARDVSLSHKDFKGVIVVFPAEFCEKVFAEDSTVLLKEE